MPYGISWFRYISFCTTAMISMLAGAQSVHMIFLPLEDLDDLIEKEFKKKLAEMERS
ncbi:PREDICTED: uncharacterized protein LOC107190561 [Dufourea novaeangliae]|uniref:Uncharacterized protein n=1 Tax=Dufourea novaeangliae TaxID=178035 RepID=A0A154PKW4_DUFNO|nr:PREDICTED: uncharacterized protein LOC107190561 [Dufourea novaeangliae]KZC12463.1 hypothetical protein WN55_04001 [Dufourea novaeangliae]